MNPLRLAALTTLVVGAALRLYDLTLRPFHHDEGVNGFFMMKLVNEGVYKYDPSNYHGPSLYYFTLPLVQLLGLTSFALRLEPVLFGIGLLVLVLLLGRRLGTWAAVAGAAFLAVSPGMVFISRYFIHEMMLLFFILGLVVAVDRYNEYKKTPYLMAAVVCLALMFATKETAAPTVVMMAIAWGMARVWMVMGGRATSAVDVEGRKTKKAKAARKEAPPPKSDEASKQGDGPHRDLAVIIWSLVVFVGINAALYTSFRSNPEGAIDALRALSFWSKTGESAHVHPFTQYLVWMRNEELGVLVLGAIGVAFALARRPNTLTVFCAFWTVGVFLMYSLIKYKTPWLTVNLVLPAAIMSGFAVQELARVLGRSVGVIVCFLALSLGLYQATTLNYVHYDDNSDRYVYVYAHTVRDINRLLHDVDILAARAPQPNPRILVVAPTYWPLPWYLKQHGGVQFFGKMTGLQDAPMVISEASPERDQTNEVRAASNGRLQPVGNYSLRPGVTLVLWAQPQLGQP